MEATLKHALLRRREYYNGIFLAAKRRHRRLDPDMFSRHLVETLAPIIAAVEDVKPEAVDAVTEALYILSLELMGQGLLGEGSKSGATDAVWQELLPVLPTFLVAAPDKLSRALCNAAHHLGNEAGVDLTYWMVAVEEIATHCSDVDMLLAGGQVLAWRAGMAHWRESALRVWGELAYDLQLATFEIQPAESPPTLEELQRRLVHRWHDPKSPLPESPTTYVPCQVARVGGFRGLEGPFRTPPRVYIEEGRIFAHDTDETWQIYADHFGALCRRHGPLVRDDKGNGKGPSIPHIRAVFDCYPALAEATSVATTSDTVVLTLPHSHFIYVFASEGAY